MVNQMVCPIYNQFVNYQQTIIAGPKSHLPIPINITNGTPLVSPGNIIDIHVKEYHYNVLI